MTTDKDFMQLALEQAKLAAAEGEVPVGAIVTLRGEVLAAEHNRCEVMRDATAHAELLAIRMAERKLERWRLTDCTLYVTLEPCPMCAGAVVNARVARVVYGATDARKGAVESLFGILSNSMLSYQPEVRAGVLEQECAELLQNFFAARRADSNV